MSQGSEGSPVFFLDPAACDEILADFRGEDGSLPTFDSERGSPPPTLEAEETHGERATQTSPVPSYRPRCLHPSYRPRCQRQTRVRKL